MIVFGSGLVLMMLRFIWPRSRWRKFSMARFLLTKRTLSTRGSALSELVMAAMAAGFTSSCKYTATATCPTMFCITASNEERMNKKTPSRTTEIAIVPTAVSAIAMLRVKFWPTSAQKKRTLPQSNMIAPALLVAGDATVHDAHGRPLRVDAGEQRHDLARCFGI